MSKSENSFLHSLSGRPEVLEFTPEDLLEADLGSYAFSSLPTLSPMNPISVLRYMNKK